MAECPSALYLGPCMGRGFCNASVAACFDCDYGFSSVGDFVGDGGCQTHWLSLLPMYIVSAVTAGLGLLAIAWDIVAMGERGRETATYLENAFLFFVSVFFISNLTLSLRRSLDIDAVVGVDVVSTLAFGFQNIASLCSFECLLLRLSRRIERFLSPPSTGLRTPVAAEMCILCLIFFGGLILSLTLTDKRPTAVLCAVAVALVVAIYVYRLFRLFRTVKKATAGAETRLTAEHRSKIKTFDVVAGYVYTLAFVVVFFLITISALPQVMPVLLSHIIAFMGLSVDFFWLNFFVLVEIPYAKRQAAPARQRPTNSTGASTESIEIRFLLLYRRRNNAASNRSLDFLSTIKEDSDAGSEQV